MGLQRGDVVFVNFPRPGAAPGHVQSGRRPAVVMHSSESLNRIPVVVVVPGTSKLAALRFPHTVAIDPAPLNGLSQRTVFIGFQVQAASADWVDRVPAGTLTEDDLRSVEDAVLDALGFEPPE